MKQSEHYFQFPIELIRDMLNNPKSVFDSILYYQCSFYDWDVLKTGSNEGINWGNVFMVDDWCKTFKNTNPRGVIVAFSCLYRKLCFGLSRKNYPMDNCNIKKIKTR